MQQGRVAIEIDAGDGALPHADGGSAVGGDQAAQELEEIGIVADCQDAVVAGIFGQHLLEVGVAGVQPQGRTDLHFGVVTQLRADKLRGLQGALEGAGDDHVHLHLERAQHARHQHALVLAFLDEAPLGIEGGILAAKSSIGVAH